MKTKTYILIIAVLMMIGCEDRITGSGKTSDAQLVQSIIEANKTAISMDDLPDQSRSVVEQDYNEYIDVDANMASQLGYEVLMGGKWHKTGDYAAVYFNLEGRKLDPNDYGTDKDGWDRDKNDWDKDNKKDWKCFDLALPFTFDMPDGSSITVEAEDGYTALRDWYEANPDSEEKPSLQYPVDIAFGDDETITVNSDDEMRSVYRRCSYRDKDKRYWDCFELVYPVTFIMPDGSTIAVADRDDWDDVKSWYDSNPDSEEKPSLQYPVDISYRDGTIQTIDNDEEMGVSKRDCWDEDGDRD